MTNGFIITNAWTVFDFFRLISRRAEVLAMSLATGSSLLYNNTNWGFYVSKLQDKCMNHGYTYLFRYMTLNDDHGDAEKAHTLADESFMA